MQRWFATGILGLSALGSLAAQTAAVLPFINRTQSATPENARTAANLDWIGQSIAETVREAFALRGVSVLDRDDVKDACKRLGLRDNVPLTTASIIKIGESLDAENVVYGTFEFLAPASGMPSSGAGSLRVTGHVLDRRHMRESPEFVETGGLSDLAVIEAHLAWRALVLIAPKLAPPEADFRALRQPIRLDAEENYIRGLLATTPDQKERYFSQAARLDARFSHPCYQLGKLYYNRKEYRQAAMWLEKVSSGDAHYREANFLLGLARYQSADYAGAMKAFQMIATVVPLSEVFNNIGASESRVNSPQAVESFRKAAEGDPNDLVYQFNLGYALWKKGDFTGATERFRAVLDRDPDDRLAMQLINRCAKKQGPRASADAHLDGLERLKTNYNERAYWQLKSLLSPEKAAAMAEKPAPEKR